MIPQINIPDASILIGLGGAAILYFGKVIGDVKVESYDKLSYYIEGLLFTSIYVFLPYIISLFVIDNLFTFPHLWAIIFQSVILGILSYTTKLHNLFKMLDLSEYLGEKLKEKLNESKKGKGITKWVSLKEPWFESIFGINYINLNLIVFNKLLEIFYNKNVLFLLSTITLISLLSVVSNNNLILFSFSLIVTLLTLTLVAIMYSAGSAYYPSAKVYLSDGKVVEGRIIKFGEFIYLVKNNEKLFLNKSYVKYVKESIFKNRVVK